MKKKYASAGLDYDLIISKFKNINDYEEAVKFYLGDPFFDEVKTYLADNDFAMAKDAIKGLYILAQDLCLYPLYIALMEVYEDLESELYNDVIAHYDEMIVVYKRIRSIYYV